MHDLLEHAPARGLDLDLDVDPERAAPASLTVDIDLAAPLRRPALRVAVVTETFPPEVNGVAATLARVCAGLNERGHLIDLVRPRQHAQDRPSPRPGFDERLVRGLPIPRYPQLKLGLPAGRELHAAWRLQRPDIVHLVTEGPLGWSALRAARQLGLPVVSDFRTNFGAYSRHYGAAWLRRPIEACLRAFHNRTACTMVPTAALSAELQQTGFQRLQVVARGVDARLFHPSRRDMALRQRWGAGPDDTVVLCVGRLAAEKNLALLLQAFDALRATEPSARLVLVGDGPERAALAQARPDAVMAGVRQGEDLAAHYASADVFLFPSVTETFGNVVPEAMASGLAVLAFDDAAAHVLIRHGDSGLLVPVGHEALFLETARALGRQRSWTRLLGARARLVACQLDWARIVQQVEAVYAQAIEQAATSGSAPALAQSRA